MSAPFIAFLPVGSWEPDRADFLNGGALTALNVIPAADSYRPFPSLSGVASALTARAQGAFYARKADGSSIAFFGDATKLYMLSGGTVSDVSRLAGGAYATPSDGYWQFVQFGALVIAVNGADVAQKFNIDSAANFSALGGSPPAAPKFIAVVGDFVVLGHTTNGNRFIEWSGINNAETWAASATTLADNQEVPDGGRIMGLIGGEYGIIVQERAIRRMTFVNVPFVFQFDKLHDNVGSAVDYSPIRWGALTFFIGRAGFYALGGDELMPIGTNKVDRWFWTNVNQAYLSRITTAINPVEKLLAISFPSTAALTGTPDTLLLYQWELGRFSYVQPGDHEMIASLVAQNSYTIDGLDALSATIDGLPFSTDSYAYTGVAQPVFGGFTTSHVFGYFNGSALEATVDTTEANLFTGQRGLLKAARPIVDGGSPTVAIRTRDDTTAAASFGSAASKHAVTGLCIFRAKARYHGGRIVVPAGSTWKHIQGLGDIEAVPMGMR